MKKLLVLVLVLGMASLASAGLKFVVPGAVDNGDGTFTVRPSDIFTVVVVNDETALPTIPAMGGISADLTYSTVAGPATILDDNIPGVWTIYEYGYDPEPVFYWIIENLEAGVGGIAANVDLVTITLHCAGEGDVLVQLWDSNFGEMLSVVIHQQIPEPASMLLLGLGGLFLRRK